MSSLSLSPCVSTVSSDDSLVFHVSDVEVRVFSDHPPAIAALRGIWGQATFGSARRLVHGILSKQDLQVCLDDQTKTVTCAQDLLLQFERMLYCSIERWHRPPISLLHAAFLVKGQSAWIFPAASGSGKSSISLALLQAGARYATDELTVYDGNKVWGLTRAIQFDLVPLGSTLPKRLAKTNQSSFLVQGDMGPMVMPFHPIPSTQVQRLPVPASNVRVVLLKQSDDDLLEPATPLEALQALINARRSPLQTDLGPLLQNPLTLRWRDPNCAAALLQAYN